MEPGHLEVRGEIVLRQRRRLSDYANHPDPMLELDGAAFRFHHNGQAGLWEDVEQLSLNRNQVILILPIDEAQPAANPRLLVSGRPVRVKAVCRSLQVTGFITVPTQMTVPAFMHESRARFLAMSDALVMPQAGGAALVDFQEIHQFCLLNRDHLIACIETRSGRES